MIGIFFWACENNLEEVKRVTQYEALPVQTILNSDITYSNNGKPSMRIEAGRIDRYPNQEDPRDEFSEGVRVTPYDGDGNIDSVVTAERATNYTKQEIMVAKDSVVVRNSEGKQLNTELLTWDKTTKKIYTDKFVRITTPNEILYGDGLEAEQDFSKYEIQNIKGRIKIDEEESDSTQNTSSQ